MSENGRNPHAGRNIEIPDGGLEQVHRETEQRESVIVTNVLRLIEASKSKESMGGNIRTTGTPRQRGQIAVNCSIDKNGEILYCGNDTTKQLNAVCIFAIDIPTFLDAIYRKEGGAKQLAPLEIASIRGLHAPFKTEVHAVIEESRLRANQYFAQQADEYVKSFLSQE